VLNDELKIDYQDCHPELVEASPFLEEGMDLSETEIPIHRE
jgi:hypothetical protein